jgi:peroxiredoxin
MDSLEGKMELTIDVSKMQDTVGRFMIMVGGEIFYPEIKNNVLTLHTLMKEPRRAFLAFYSAQQIKESPGKELNYIPALVSNNIVFLGLPGRYKILVQGTIANAEILNSSPHQKKYAELRRLIRNFDTKMLDEQAVLITEIKTKDSLIRNFETKVLDEPAAAVLVSETKNKDSLISIYYKQYREKYPKYYQDTILGFVKNNPDEPAALLELEEYSYSNDKNLTTLSILYNNLTKRLKDLPTAKRVSNTIDEERFSSSLIGKQAPMFVQRDPLGKSVSLNDFKGNIMLLEFWASWCGACRASNPGIVKTYQKYKNKGFKILGVSLDSEKERWIKAIKDDSLTWTHVSDLKEFNNAVAVLYHVKSIPSNFLIDKSGKVIATDVDEKVLDGHLENLLK